MKWFFVFSMILFVCLFFSCKSSDDDDNDDATDDDEWLDDDSSDEDDDEADDDVVETWTDETSGLMWQVDPPESEFVWSEANTYCQNLSLAGFDDWRLPTISELRSIIRGCNGTSLVGECGVFDNCPNYETCYNNSCHGCEELIGSNHGFYLPQELENPCEDWYGTCDLHHVGEVFSSTACENQEDLFWTVHFAYGLISLDFEKAQVRCVR